MENHEKLLFEARLDACYDHLSQAEKRVADYIRKNMDTVGSASSQLIAKESGTGPATVVRFCRSCGFSGLTELKSSLKREEIVLARMDDMNIYPEDSVSVIKQKVLNYHQTVIENMKSNWNEDALAAAVDAILGANRIVVSGAGDSSAMAIILNNNLDQQGCDSFFCNDQVQELAQLSRLKEGDVLIGFSYSGRFQNTARNFKLAHQRGIITIGILGIPEQPAERYLDIILYTSRGKKEYYFGSQRDLIGDFAVIEILTTILATRRTPEDAHKQTMHNFLEMHRFPKNEKF